MAGSPPDAAPAVSFEAALDELEKVVKELEAGDLSLDRSTPALRTLHGRERRLRTAQAGPAFVRFRPLCNARLARLHRQGGLPV
jgi:hypothetical protein